MSPFKIQPHNRLQEWVAEEKGYFRDEGLDYTFHWAGSADGVGVGRHYRMSGSVQSTEEAPPEVKSGAFDYLIKPVDFEHLSQVLGRAFEAARLMSVPAVLPDEDRDDRIIGRSPVMQEMCKLIGRVAPQEVNVLILGESGTGKELVARALYQHSRRAAQPFLAINCAAIPETLLESELFGHVRGAFTGATHPKDGLLATFSCSHHVSEAAFAQTIADALVDARRSARKLRKFEQALDHPVLPTIPETEYFKGILLEMMPGR